MSVTELRRLVDAIKRGEAVSSQDTGAFQTAPWAAVAELRLERDRLREAIQRHHERIEWCGEVRVADEQSREVAKLKHQADSDLWKEAEHDG